MNRCGQSDMARCNHWQCSPLCGTPLPFTTTPRRQKFIRYICYLRTMCYHLRNPYSFCKNCQVEVFAYYIDPERRMHPVCNPSLFGMTLLSSFQCLGRCRWSTPSDSDCNLSQSDMRHQQILMLMRFRLRQVSARHRPLLRHFVWREVTMSSLAPDFWVRLGLRHTSNPAPSVLVGYAR